MKQFRSQVILACGLILLLGATNVASGAVPPNDDCDNAKTISDATDLQFDTADATFDGSGLCMTSPNIWYCYTATCTGDVTVSLAGSSFDTMLAVYDGCECDPKSNDLIECNDDAVGFQSEITFAAVAGNQYLIEVGGYGSETGPGLLSISCEGVTPPPSPKDDCENAKEIGDVTDQTFDTTDATFDGSGLCMTSPNIWYCYTATCTGDVTVSLAGSSFDTMLAVYDGCECDPTSDDLIECNDDAVGYQSEITFAAITGNQYLIEIGGYGSENGPGLLSISCEEIAPPPPSQDDCENADEIGDVTDEAFDTTDATFDGSGPCMTSPNIWYRYTATCTGNATVSLAGSSFDTMLAVYDEYECDPTSDDLIECNDDAGAGYQSAVTFAAIIGNQYLIEVGGYGTETGPGLLSISCEGVTPPPSSKDDCENAKAIGDVTDQAFDTTDATFDGSGLCMTSPNIWYCYTATCTGNATVSLAGSSFDTMLAVYDGCECYPTSDDLIECNDDAGAGYQSAVTFVAIAGSQYLIEVGGYGSENGEGLISISCEGMAIQGKADLGDAPDSTNNFGVEMTAYPSSHTGLPYSIQANYPTVYDDGSGTGPYGPIHVNDNMVAYLGKTITREIEADTGPDEDTLNNIRPTPGSSSNIDNGDDAIKLNMISLPNCCWTTIDYEVTVVDPSVDVWVNIWLDWNRDGDWDDVLDCPEGDAPEWAVQNQFLFNLPTGLNQLTSPAFLPWHSDDRPENIWMRITLSEQPWKTGSNPGEVGNAGSGPVTKYDIGETEDYYWNPETTCSICKDHDGDGDIDMDDLVYYTAEWLDKCP